MAVGQAQFLDNNKPLDPETGEPLVGDIDAFAQQAQRAIEPPGTYYSRADYSRLPTPSLVIAEDSPDSVSDLAKQIGEAAIEARFFGSRLYIQISGDSHNLTSIMSHK
ncbi:MAG: hypothetical protein LBH14_02590 [Desulfobulbaceae bacterium]|nr:hypothetical protein [Desulfobulbaceae bacterium]